jgi:hypothetical protein
MKFAPSLQLQDAYEILWDEGEMFYRVNNAGLINRITRNPLGHLGLLWETFHFSFSTHVDDDKRAEDTAHVDLWCSWRHCSRGPVM